MSETPQDHPYTPSVGDGHTENDLRNLETCLLTGDTINVFMVLSGALIRGQLGLQFDFAPLPHYAEYIAAGRTVSPENAQLVINSSDPNAVLEFPDFIFGTP